jgi:hypothetical protein
MLGWGFGFELLLGCFLREKKDILREMRNESVGEMAGVGPSGIDPG